MQLSAIHNSVVPHLHEEANAIQFIKSLCHQIIMYAKQYIKYYSEYRRHWQRVIVFNYIHIVEI